MQSVEERFVLVRANSFDQAQRKLGPMWRRYARPYMNGAGRLVRWQLESVEDVYLVGDDEPTRTDGEVFSRIRERRVTKGRAWLPKW
jgi:hypothetical protein